MTEPTPITKALGKAIGRNTTIADADLRDNALEANPQRKARRARNAADIESRRSVRSVARSLGMAELAEMNIAGMAPETLANVTRAAAIDTALRLLAGEWEITHAGQAAQVIKALTEVSRLELGQATAINHNVNADVTDQLEAMKQAVAARIAQRTSIPAESTEREA